MDIVERNSFEPQDTLSIYKTSRSFWLEHTVRSRVTIDLDLPDIEYHDISAVINGIDEFRVLREEAISAITDSDKSYAKVITLYKFLIPTIEPSSDFQKIQTKVRNISKGIRKCWRGPPLPVKDVTIPSSTLGGIFDSVLSKYESLHATTPTPTDTVANPNEHVILWDEGRDRFCSYDSSEGVEHNEDNLQRTPPFLFTRGKNATTTQSNDLPPRFSSTPSFDLDVRYSTLALVDNSFGEERSLDLQLHDVTPVGHQHTTSSSKTPPSGQPLLLDETAEQNVKKADLLDNPLEETEDNTHLVRYLDDTDVLRCASWILESFDMPRASQTIQISKYTGSHNFVYTFADSQGGKYVMRVPIRGLTSRWNTADALRLIRNARATQHVNQHTAKVPVPRVYCYEGLADNDFGFPFVFTEHLEGSTLSWRWAEEVDLVKRTKYVASVSASLAELVNFPFASAGEANFDDGNMSPLPSDDGASGSLGHHDSIAHYKQMLHAWFRNMLDVANTEQRDLAHGQYMVLKMLINHLPSSLIFQEGLRERFVFASPVNDLDHILVDDRGNVTGIIEIEAQAVPEYAGYVRYPDWVLEDFAPSYTWTGEIATSPQSFDCLRAEWVSALKRAMAPLRQGDDWKYSAKSHLFRMIHLCLEQPMNTLHYLEQILPAILPRVNIYTYLSKLGSENFGLSQEEKEWLDGKIQEWLECRVQTDDFGITDPFSSDVDALSPIRKFEYDPTIDDSTSMTTIDETLEQHNSNKKEPRVSRWERIELLDFQLCEQIVRRAIGLSEDDPSLQMTGKFGRGTYNAAVYFYHSGTADKWVLRIPVAGVCGDWSNADATSFRSSAMTMQYLKKHTKVPLPDVLTFASDTQNELGCPYVVMSFVHGRELKEIWYEDLDMDLRKNILKSVAETTTEFSVLGFDAEGSLSFDDLGSPYVPDMVPVKMPREVEDVHGVDTLLCCTMRPSIKNSYDEVNSWLEEWQDYHMHHSDELEERVRGLYQVFKMIRDCHPYIQPEKFVLSLPDFDTQNILIDDEGNVVSVLDFDWVSATPQRAGWARCPNFLCEDFMLDIPFRGPEDPVYHLLPELREVYGDYLKEAVMRKGTNGWEYFSTSHLWNTFAECVGRPHDTMNYLALLVPSFIPYHQVCQAVDKLGMGGSDAEALTEWWRSNIKRAFQMPAVSDDEPAATTNKMADEAYDNSETTVIGRCATAEPDGTARNDDSQPSTVPYSDSDRYEDASSSLASSKLRAELEGLLTEPQLSPSTSEHGDGPNGFNIEFDLSPELSSSLCGSGPGLLYDFDAASGSLTGSTVEFQSPLCRSSLSSGSHMQQATSFGIRPNLESSVASDDQEGSRAEDPSKDEASQQRSDSVVTMSLQFPPLGPSLPPAQESVSEGWETTDEDEDDEIPAPRPSNPERALVLWRRPVWEAFPDLLHLSTPQAAAIPDPPSDEWESDIPGLADRLDSFARDLSTSRSDEEQIRDEEGDDTLTRSFSALSIRSPSHPHSHPHSPSRLSAPDPTGVFARLSGVSPTRCTACERRPVTPAAVASTVGEEPVTTVRIPGSPGRRGDGMSGIPSPSKAGRAGRGRKYAE